MDLNEFNKRLTDTGNAYRKALYTPAPHVQILFIQGKRFGMAKRFDKAIVMFHKALALDENYTEAYNFLARAHMELKQYAEAIDVYTKLMKLEGETLYSLCERCLAYLACEKWDDAIKDAEMAAKLAPRGETYLMLSMTYQYTDRNTEALECALKAEELSPKLPDLPYMLGSCYQRLDEDEKALPYLLRAFNQDKRVQRDLDMNMMLAVSYRKLKKYDLSLQYIERVEGLNRNSSELFFHKGLVYYETREYSKALGCFFSSFKLDPENDTVAFHIGKVYEVMGKTEEAEKYLELSRQLEKKAKLLEEQGAGEPSTAKEQ